MSKIVPPTIAERAFNCPHCGVLTSQAWFSVLIAGTRDDQPPLCLSGELEDHEHFWKDDDDRASMKQFIGKMISGEPFTDPEDSRPYGHTLHNASVSRCFNCKAFAIWVHNNLAWPTAVTSIEPNADLPPSIALDFREAAKIVDLSPRGASAMLRLAVQKLCKHLGGGGENINSDIKALVSAGLDRRIQQALDIVRVVGNNAVHPGQIDLRDDKGTAQQLFRLINLIADKMISEPKHVAEMYESLPESARSAIEKRDARQTERE
jgi:hypothetical protein